MADRLTFTGSYARFLRIYVRWLPSLLLLGLIVFIPLGLVHSLVVSAEIESFDFDGITELVGTLAAFAALTVTALLGEVFYTGAVAAFLTHTREDGPPPLREVATSIRYGTLVLVDVLYGVVVAVGLLLLIGPGVAAFVYLALAAPVVEIEERGARAAFARSARLVRGRFWTVLAILVPLELLETASTRAGGAIGHDLLHDGLLSHWLAEVISSLMFTPLYAVAAVTVTTVLIREKEGAGPPLHSAPVRA